MRDAARRTNQPRGGLGGSTNLRFAAPAGNKYKVTVTDCLGNKAVYKIDKNGTSHWSANITTGQAEDKLWRCQDRST
jgi:hypothetical protein